MFGHGGDWAGYLAQTGERAILIRNCDNYDGLGAGWFRIAVKSHADNERLVAALQEVLG